MKFGDAVERAKPVARRALEAIGYDTRHWTRPVMYDTCTRWLKEIGIDRLDVLEVSAGNYWRTLPFRSYCEANYPDFDICEEALSDKYDLIIADQVFEHLVWPRRAAINVLSMLRPGGYFLMTTPFLIRVHAIPVDCTRWTEMGIRYFLADAGFPIDSIKTGSWGNRNCVKANFRKWARRGWFGSMSNEPDFPVSVWALAQAKLPCPGSL